MDSVSRRRWSLAFVAFRWRHLLWTFPLAGLLVAGAIEWEKYQRSLQPSGEIAVAPPPRLSPPPLYAGRLSTFGFAEIQQIALSDEVLAAACEYAELTRDGTPLEKCVAELRPRVQCTPIPGSSSALISVAGKPSPETKLLTEAMLRKIEWYADKTAFTERKALLKQAEKDLAEFKLRISQEQPDKVPAATTVYEIGSNERLKLITDSMVNWAAWKEKHSEESTDRKLQLAAAARFDKAARAPLLVKRWPSTPLPLPTPRQRILEGTPTVMLGIGTGILAAVVLAYLLEALFPKRHRDHRSPALQE